MISSYFATGWIKNQRSTLLDIILTAARIARKKHLELWFFIAGCIGWDTVIGVHAGKTRPGPGEGMAYMGAGSGRHGCG